MSTPVAVKEHRRTLDPVTFEVLKNAVINSVDLMAEQILRTCHSFVIYSRDFSSAICDRNGDTVAQGNYDGAAHVGTLHFTAKAIIEAFEDDIHEGDVFVINDPYLGGTHFSDVRVVRPIFADGELIAFAQSNGHWADVGGSVPGSFDVTAREHFGEGLRITPIRLWDRGEFKRDVAQLILANVRAPSESAGDLDAQAEATRVAETEILRLVERYGRETVLDAFAEMQDYVERVVRQRVRELPDGTWSGVDYLDEDFTGAEGLVAVRVKMTISGDQVIYDLGGSDPTVASLYNSAFGSTYSGIFCGTKYFFPDVPLNSGFYRVIDVDLGPTGSVVNAVWPTSVTGFAMPYEKIVNLLIEMWSRLIPERAMACSFNNEYLQIGGKDSRSDRRPRFMWYDWLTGGWGGRQGRDGASATTGLFCAQLESQPVEGQERLCPCVHSEWQLSVDSGGPGEYRGGLGVIKKAELTNVADCVMSYLCDRARAIVWGTEGGLPSGPHGVWIQRPGESPEYMGVAFANVSITSGTRLWRPSVGGGGYGDPLNRDPEAVQTDVVGGYVSFERARRDYGVVLKPGSIDDEPYIVDDEGTALERERIRSERRGWLKEDPESVAERYRGGELDAFDLVRQYGVIVDWGSGELYPKTTEQFRAAMVERSSGFWR